MNTKNPQHEISFYGKMLSFSRIHLTTNDFDVIISALEKVSPEKNSDIPIVIDADVELDLKKLVNLLWDWGLQPIGVVKGKLDEQAKELRLALFPSEGKRIQRVTVKPTINPIKDKANQAKQEIYKNDKEKAKVGLIDNELEIDFNEIDKLGKKKNLDNGQKQLNDVEVKVEAEPLEKVTSLVYDHLLRSGQSVNHVGGDLILTNSVNDGAEAITDNSLHIYGKGMGRLVAGATGDQDAHIFCQKFNPSLVSVAGTYMLRDTIPPEVLDKPVQVSYKEGEGLVFRIMDESLNHTTNNAFNTINHKK
ncbi:MAG: septum site-determining protein MinC [Moraxellaceae bacterium]|nr:septum site-determining protein MinC [Moraxellaceae bacterium]